MDYRYRPLHAEFDILHAGSGGIQRRTFEESVLHDVAGWADQREPARILVSSLFSFFRFVFSDKYFPVFDETIKETETRGEKIFLQYFTYRRSITGIS